MTVILERVRHRVTARDGNDWRLAWTACDIRFCWVLASPGDRRHHEPARRRCRRCYG